jgi:hypothetical protein
VNDDVLITVKAGDAQHLAGYQLHTPDGKYHNGPFLNFRIGKGSDLKGKESKLTATITDTNPNTNFTSIVINLSNQETVKTYSESSEFDNSTVIYLITIKHK